MPGPFWKAKDLQLARALREQGVPYRDIAKQLPGRTPNSIRNAVMHRHVERVRSKPVPLATRLPDPMLPVLRDAMMRYANDNGLDLAQAMNVLLCAGEAR